MSLFLALLPRIQLTYVISHVFVTCLFSQQVAATITNSLSVPAVSPQSLQTVRCRSLCLTPTRSFPGFVQGRPCRAAPFTHHLPQRWQMAFDDWLFAPSSQVHYSSLFAPHIPEQTLVNNSSLLEKTLHDSILLLFINFQSMSLLSYCFF